MKPVVNPLEDVKAIGAIRRQARDVGTVRDVLDKVPRTIKKQAVRDDKRPHCKARPNRSKGGGGGSKKGFVPWC